MLDCPITINKGDEMNKTWLIKKHKTVIATVKAPHKVNAVIKAWEKINRISNLKAIMKKFGHTKTFLFAELKLGSSGYYLDKQIKEDLNLERFKSLKFKQNGL